MKYSFKFKLFGQKVQMFSENGMGIVVEKEPDVVCVYGTGENHKPILCAIPLCSPKLLRGMEYTVEFSVNSIATVSVAGIKIRIDFENKKCSNNKGLAVYGSEAWGKDVSEKWIENRDILTLCRNEDTKNTGFQKYTEQLEETLIAPMTEFMEDGGDFTKEDVAECKTLILKYLNALSDMKEVSDEAIMKEVKTLVLALNALNEKTDYSLIETGEREAICEIIQSSAVERGLTDYDDDITEEWRDW